MSITQLSQVEGGLIDRLVDGELDENERQRLLARLEAEVGGWRRCALAFLEAQAWTHTLNSITTETLPRDQVPSILVTNQPTTIPASPRIRRRWLPSGRLAAGILLAFVSGWLVGGAPRSSTPAPTPGSSTRPQSPGVDPGLAALNRPESAADSGQKGLEPATFDPVESKDEPRFEAPIRPSQSSHVLHESVRREWERQGYQVQHRSGRVSLKLENGQSLDVPVDEVELRYVGNRTY